MRGMNRTEVHCLRSNIIDSAKDFPNWNDNDYFRARVKAIADFVAMTLVNPELDVALEGRSLERGMRLFCERTIREPHHLIKIGHELAVKVANGRSVKEERDRLLVFYEALLWSFDFVMGR
jgi:hypothetical protein